MSVCWSRRQGPTSGGGVTVTNRLATVPRHSFPPWVEREHPWVDQSRMHQDDQSWSLTRELSSSPLHSIPQIDWYESNPQIKDVLSPSPSVLSVRSTGFPYHKFLNMTRDVFPLFLHLLTLRLLLLHFITLPFSSLFATKCLCPLFFIWSFRCLFLPPPSSSLLLEIE